MLGLKLVYRPKTHYGSFLRALRSVSFQTLNDIKRFYGIAFGKPFTDLFESIDESYIEVLAAFRNAIAHNAGRADKQFVLQVASFKDFSGIKETDTLQLEGGLVLRLRNVSSRLGKALIEKMDALLSPPETQT